MRKFIRSLPMALLRAREAVMSEFTPVLRKHGLSPQQWRVLRVLMERDEIDAKELAQLSYLQKPSLSRILANLDNRGFLNRKIDSEDQRRSLISIKEKGKELFNTVSPYNERRYDHIEEVIGEKKLDQLYSLLDEMIEKIHHENHTDTIGE
jgi:homoprotocatechuate degradation regulator HpaR